MKEKQKQHKHPTQKSRWQSAGFTIIELLVVISILGLLASTLLVNFKQARIKARDAKRIADINQLAKALELFYSQYGFYPHCSIPGYPGGCDVTGWPESDSTVDTSVDGHFMEFLKPYLSSTPKDPINDLNSFHTYFFVVDPEFPVGSGRHWYYLLGTGLEDTTNPALQNSITKGDLLYGSIYGLGVAK